MKFGQDTLESMSQAQWYNSWTLNKFEKYLGGRILEVGCGIGNFTKILTSHGEVFAIDIEKKYLNRVEQDNEKVKAGFGDIENGKYFFKDTKFNCIVCLNVLEHIKNDELALKNMYKLMVDGGKLILLVPAHQFLYGGIDQAIKHFRRYEKNNLAKILEGMGFKVITARRLNFLGAIGWFIAGKILKAKIVNKSSIRIFNLIAPFILRMEDLIEPPIGTSIFIIAQKND